MREGEGFGAGAHWESQELVVGLGGDLTTMDRRRRTAATEVKDDDDDVAMARPGSLGSVEMTKTMSWTSWACPGGEGEAVAVVTASGGVGYDRWRCGEDKSEEGRSAGESERGPGVRGDAREVQATGG